MLERRSSSPLPAVLGHEGAGFVAAVGSSVTGPQIGDHGTMTFPSCCTCRALLKAAEEAPLSVLLAEIERNSQDFKTRRLNETPTESSAVDGMNRRSDIFHSNVHPIFIGCGSLVDGLCQPIMSCPQMCSLHSRSRAW